MGDVVANPVRGNDGLYLTLKKIGDAGAAVEYDGHVLSHEFTNEDREGLTYAEVQSGDVKATGLKLTLVIDMTTGSLWRLLWDNPAGKFDAIVGPYGNVVATDDAPHFTGVLKATGKPLAKSTANTARTRETVEYDLTYESGPDIDDGI